MPRLFYLLLLSLLFPLRLSAHAPTSVNFVFDHIEVVTPNIMRVPFNLVGGLPIVQATVNGESGNFIFDTGAIDLVLNNKYFGSETANYQASAAGVTGSVGTVGNKKVERFRLDNLIAENFNVDVIDLTHIERKKRLKIMGLVGYGVLEEFALLFDYSLSQVILIRTDKKGKPYEELPADEYTGPKTFELNELTGHIAIMKLTFGKTKLSFGLDSGAEQNLLDHYVSGKFLKANFEITKRVNLNGTGGESIEVISGLLNNATFNTMTFTQMKTLITNLESINASYGTQVDGILGYEFFNQYPVLLNYRNKTVTFFDNI